jgi:hypothetical protein
MSRIYDSNRNSRIVSRNREGTVFGRQTFTSQRDEGTLNAVIETESNNATTFTIQRAGAQLELNGNEARTIFNVLAKHYYGG